MSSHHDVTNLIYIFQENVKVRISQRKYIKEQISHQTEKHLSRMLIISFEKLWNICSWYRNGAL